MVLKKKLKDLKHTITCTIISLFEYPRYWRAKDGIGYVIFTHENFPSKFTYNQRTFYVENTHTHTHYVGGVLSLLVFSPFLSLCYPFGVLHLNGKSKDTGVVPFARREESRGRDETRRTGV